MALHVLRLVLLALSLTLTGLAVPLNLARGIFEAVTLPSQDPFYQPPANLASAQLGEVLRQREVSVPAAIELLAPGKTKTVWQILYRSQDDFGQPLAVVTTLFVPNGGDPKKLYTQANAYDASDVDCSPSYTLRSFPDTTPDSIVVALALNKGWFVQSPDFESYKAVFANGIISGQTLLDSLRACKKSSSFTGLSSDPRIGINGGSGGALACEWAVELQPTYAKDITISGASLGSLTPNVSNVLIAVNKGDDAALIPVGLTGLAQGSTDLTSYLKNNLVASTADDFYSARTRCLNDNDNHYKDKDITTYFKHPNYLNDAPVHDIIQRVGIMGTHGTPSGPVYIYKGVKDVLSPVADTDALYNKFCSAHAPSVTYIRNDQTDHRGESVIGLFGALNWLSDRFNGVTTSAGCSEFSSEKTTLDSSDASSVGDNGAEIVAALQAVLNNPAQNIATILTSLTKR